MFPTCFGNLICDAAVKIPDRRGLAALQREVRIDHDRRRRAAVAQQVVDQRGDDSFFFVVREQLSAVLQELVDPAGDGADRKIGGAGIDRQLHRVVEHVIRITVNVRLGDFQRAVLFDLRAVERVRERNRLVAVDRAGNRQAAAHGARLTTVRGRCVVFPARFRDFILDAAFQIHDRRALAALQREVANDHDWITSAAGVAQEIVDQLLDDSLLFILREQLSAVLQELVDPAGDCGDTNFHDARIQRQGHRVVEHVVRIAAVVRLGDRQRAVLRKNRDLLKVDHHKHVVFRHDEGVRRSVIFNGFSARNRRHSNFSYRIVSRIEADINIDLRASRNILTGILLFIDVSRHCSAVSRVNTDGYLIPYRGLDLDGHVVLGHREPPFFIGVVVREVYSFVTVGFDRHRNDTIAIPRAEIKADHFGRYGTGDHLMRHSGGCGHDIRVAIEGDRVLRGRRFGCCELEVNDDILCRHGEPKDGTVIVLCHREFVRICYLAIDKNSEIPDLISFCGLVGQIDDIAGSCLRRPGNGLFILKIVAEDLAVPLHVVPDRVGGGSGSLRAFEDARHDHVLIRHDEIVLC